MTKRDDTDWLEVETHMLALRGHIYALSMMASSDELQGAAQQAVHSMADTMEKHEQALHKLLFPRDAASEEPAA